MSRHPTYIVNLPLYADDVGGVIALYDLADTLASLGERVRLWAFKLTREKAMTLPPVVVRGHALARVDELNDDAIIVYPEIILGNPVGMKNVARWLLNRPGRLKGTYEFGPDELFFAFSGYSDDPAITGGAQRLFTIALNPVYADEGRPDRTGSCFMVRKGVGKPQVHPPDAIALDGLPHDAVARAFNTTQTFYCYDEATLFSQYAALCGCTSIVVPGLYPDRAAWVQARPIAQYGVAFGLDDIPHALATRHLVAGHLEAFRQAGRASVADFVARTREHFGFDPPPAQRGP